MHVPFALVGPPRAQPPALVGRWRPLDASGVPSADLVLVLHESAQAWEEAHGERTAPRSWWWVYAASGESPARLCVGWRPGRRAAECRAFALDSVGGDVARRLTWGERRYAREVVSADVSARATGE
jgi:hypothetical protein